MSKNKNTEIGSGMKNPAYPQSGAQGKRIPQPQPYVYPVYPPYYPPYVQGGKPSDGFYGNYVYPTGYAPVAPAGNGTRKAMTEAEIKKAKKKAREKAAFKLEAEKEAKKKAKIRKAMKAEEKRAAEKQAKKQGNNGEQPINAAYNPQMQSGYYYPPNYYAYPPAYGYYAPPANPPYYTFGGVAVRKNPVAENQAVSPVSTDKRLEKLRAEETELERALQARNDKKTGKKTNAPVSPAYAPAPAQTTMIAPIVPVTTNTNQGTVPTREELAERNESLLQTQKEIRRKAKQTKADAKAQAKGEKLQRAYAAEAAVATAGVATAAAVSANQTPTRQEMKLNKREAKTMAEQEALEEALAQKWMNKATETNAAVNEPSEPVSPAYAPAPAQTTMVAPIVPVMTNTNQGVVPTREELAERNESLRNDRKEMRHTAKQAKADGKAQKKEAKLQRAYAAEAAVATAGVATAAAVSANQTPTRQEMKLNKREAKTMAEQEALEEALAQKWMNKATETNAAVSDPSVSASPAYAPAPAQTTVVAPIVPVTMNTNQGAVPTREELAERNESLRNDRKEMRHTAKQAKADGKAQKKEAKLQRAYAAEAAVATAGVATAAAVSANQTPTKQETKLTKQETKAATEREALEEALAQKWMNKATETNAVVSNEEAPAPVNAPAPAQTTVVAPIVPVTVNSTQNDVSTREELADRGENLRNDRKAMRQEAKQAKADAKAQKKEAKLQRAYTAEAAVATAAVGANQTPTKQEEKMSLREAESIEERRIFEEAIADKWMNKAKEPVKDETGAPVAKEKTVVPVVAPVIVNKESHISEEKQDMETSQYTDPFAECRKADGLSEEDVMNPLPAKRWLVTCPACGTKLVVTEGSFAYRCPECGDLFQTRKVYRNRKETNE